MAGNFPLWRTAGFYLYCYTCNKMCQYLPLTPTKLIKINNSFQLLIICLHRPMGFNGSKALRVLGISGVLEVPALPGVLEVPWALGPAFPPCPIFQNSYFKKHLWKLLLNMRHKLKRMKHSEKEWNSILLFRLHYHSYKAAKFIKSGVYWDLCEKWILMLHVIARIYKNLYWFMEKFLFYLHHLNFL